MALVEGCRHSLEISVPVETVDTETERVVSSFQQRAKLPGFRPGKAPAGLIRKQFAGDIRQQVIENLVPKFLDQELQKQELKIVGTPDITDVHFHDGEPLRFKAEFEVVPEIELKDYQRSRSALPRSRSHRRGHRQTHRGNPRAEGRQYVNVDPRPARGWRLRRSRAREPWRGRRRAGQAG